MWVEERLKFFVDHVILHRSWRPENWQVIVSYLFSSERWSVRRRKSDRKYGKEERELENTDIEIATIVFNYKQRV